MFQQQLRTPAPAKPIYNDILDCSARLPTGGMPTTEILRKLEETDISAMGFQNYDNYLTNMAENKDSFMRYAVTDRNMDEPAFGDDTPAYNATKNSGKLNARYNSGRGTTDYLPYHPEIFIGEQGEELPIYMAKTKKFTASIAAVNEHRMGDNDENVIPEQAWSQPEISYAKKDMLKWKKNIYNHWDWPSFINHQTQNTRFFDPSETMRRRHESMMMGDETIQTGPELRDEYSRVVKPHIGYEYYLPKWSEHTIAFADQDKNTQRKAINESDPALTRRAQADCELKEDESKYGYNRKRNLAIQMKVAIQNQQTTTDFKKSTHGTDPRRMKEKENKSVITRMVKDHVEQREADSKLMSAPKFEKDYIKTHWKAGSSVPSYVIGNLHGIKKAMKGQEDSTKIRKQVEEDRIKQREAWSRQAGGLLQGKDLTNKVDDTVHTSKLYTSSQGILTSNPDTGGLDRGKGLANKLQIGHDADDLMMTKAYSAAHPTLIPRHDMMLDNKTFEQSDNLESRDNDGTGRPSAWCRH